MDAFTPIKQYPDGGRANYIFHCSTCGKEFFGVKRDQTCPTCGDNHADDLDALKEQIKELEAILEGRFPAGHLGDYMEQLMAENNRFKGALERIPRLPTMMNDDCDYSDWYHAACVVAAEALK